MKTSLRDKNIVLLRPKVNSNKNISYKNDIEKFQNIVLRPILKFQNDLLLELFIFEFEKTKTKFDLINNCLLYTSPSPRDRTRSRMPSSA